MILIVQCKGQPLTIFRENCERMKSGYTKPLKDVIPSFRDVRLLFLLLGFGLRARKAAGSAPEMPMSPPPISLSGGSFT